METSQSSNIDKHNFTNSNDITRYKVKAVEENNLYKQPIIVPHKKIPKKYSFSKFKEN